jgi:hypothetical protein
MGRWSFVLSLAPLLALGAGCVSMELPEPFVVLEKGTSELKAVTPDDARVWVRERSVSENAKLAFWAEVLRNEFVTNRGYTLVEERAAKDGSGVEGKEFVFEATIEGTAQRYLVAVFVHEGWLSNTVCTVELVAPKEVFAKLVDGVRKGIETLDP